jgi:hypothetical protein
VTLLWAAVIVMAGFAAFALVSHRLSVASIGKPQVTNLLYTH